MERLKGEGGIGRSRSGKSNVLRRWKISRERERERERECYSKDGREIFRVCVMYVYAVIISELINRAGHVASSRYPPSRLSIDEAII